MKSHKHLVMIGAGIMAAVGMVAVPSVAFAGTTGGGISTAAISAGTLGFLTAPGPVGFATTLNGTDQDVTNTTNQTFDVSDATGSGNGWNITATSTAFTMTDTATPAVTHYLANTSVTEPVAPAASTCDGGAGKCTLPTNLVTYVYTMPAAQTTAPTATKIYNAAVVTGLGNSTSTHILHLAVPQNTYAGNYTSTWTYSLISAP
jgi:hypothetical protein